MISTKIVATIGPSCDSIAKISTLLNLGVNVFRFNLKHNTQKWHSVRIQRVKEASKQAGIPVAILLDMQGPEIRIGTFKNGSIELKKGEKVYFVLAEKNASRKEIILDNLKLLQSFKKNDEFTIDDGKFRFRVLSEMTGEVEAEVEEGGVLKNSKGVNVPNLEIDLPTLVKKDFEDLSLAALHDVDFLALSFVRTVNDVLVLREEIKKRGMNAKIVSKIETGLALKNIKEIVKESDGVMVARGDLGVEIDLEQVPYFQKKIIKECIAFGKPVITATQMLESMIENPRPTRAEVSDVANAIFDHTDAVMLSAESAAGAYPEKSVSMLYKIAEFNEEKTHPIDDVTYDMGDQTSAMTFSAFNLLNKNFCEKEKITAIIVLTETGNTPRLLARLRPSLPIVALTRNVRVRDQLMLSWGVHPVLLPSPKSFYDKKDHLHVSEFVKIVKAKGFAKKGEKVVLVYSQNWGKPGSTNIIRIEEVE